ncbi:MAG: sigma-70 family RNA polymerase sigma factor [Isosphaeraceae bacterium]|nr:sigma-70 family RNA polymerase sigma factor [Isosphaeraceae bacterium]
MASTRVGETVRHLRLIFSGKSVAGQSDAALLHRFVASRDEEAFGVLVARHGPMVWAVCGDILRDRSDIEDAFQTTFLTLVKRAHSLWVDESLGGWLYRVAYHSSLKIGRKTSLRRTKEQTGAELANVSQTEPDRQNAAELHEAIARLPERYRRPLVLCDLEGMPQLEAAQLLRYGEATLRRRLASARERLKQQLTRQGMTARLFYPLQTLTQGTLPAGLVAATTRAALAVRPGLAGIARFASMVLIVGTITLAGVAYALNHTEEPKPHTPPQPNAEEAVVNFEDRPEIRDAIARNKAKMVPVHWVHLKSDQGYETWINSDAGVELTRKGVKVTLLDAAKRERLTYKADGAIEKDEPHWLKGDKDESGRFTTPGSRELVLSPWTLVPRNTPPNLRPGPPSLTCDYNFDTLNGKNMIREDQYDHDALGKSRLYMQIWYDAETRRCVRKKDLYQLGEQQRYGKEFQTIDYDYPETGPADVHALGVPRDAKLVDLEKTRSPKWVNQAPEVQRAIKAQVEAIRKFPRAVRVVTKDDRGTIHLQYSTVSESYVDGFCKEMISGARYSWNYDDNRNFEADNQEYGDRPDDLFPRLKAAPDGSFDAEKVVQWFPLEKSLNTSLNDGQMTYDMTRFDPPRVHVMNSSYASFCNAIDNQWPVVRMRWQGPEFIPPNAETPPGMVMIKANSKIDMGEKDEPYPHYYALDPAHDWIAVRVTTWEKEHEKETWQKEETVAKAFKQLSNGSWYVSLWERSRTDGLEFEKPTTRKPERVGYIRTHVKSMRPEDFPKDIFNGPLFLKNATASGAKIEPD